MEWKTSEECKTNENILERKEEPLQDSIDMAQEFMKQIEKIHDFVIRQYGNPCAKVYYSLYYPHNSGKNKVIIWVQPLQKKKGVGFEVFVKEQPGETSRPTVAVREKHSKCWNEAIEFFKYFYDYRKWSE